MKWPEPGDIVCLTVFRWTDESQNLAEPPLWGRAEMKVDHPEDGVGVVPLCGGRPEIWDEESNEFSPHDEPWTISADIDRWSIVLDEDVPEEVWAAIARKALS